MNILFALCLFTNEGSELKVPNLIRLGIIFIVFFLHTSISLAAPHPLRPFPRDPNDLIDDTDPSFLTPNSAQRPTAVQSNRFDKRHETITFTVQGNLNSNFTEFITPLLSVTNPENPDYDLEYEQQAKRYLADYLEGRAYYEPFQEPTNPTPDQSRGLLSRTGVFRKLAPLTYQDKLKRILIKRGHGDYETLEELKEIYGFKPSSVRVNPDTPVQYLTLNDFYNNWAPLPEEYNTSKDYEVAYNSWKNCDEDEKNCSQWFNLWPYVPMFTREDSVGQIITYDEPDQTSSPQIISQVYHPHLARTYEVSSALSSMFTPKDLRQPPKDPQLFSQWLPAPWTTDPFWIDSGQNLSLDSGTVCDPQNTLILSSGDLALDSQINTSVNKTITINNPKLLAPLASPIPCGNNFIEYSCEHCKAGPGKIDFYLDDSDCYYKIDVRFSPTSFQTLTPFLAEITDNLATGKFALFNIFRSQAEIQANPPENWPGVGYESEENPLYSFDSGSAEAGLKNPGNTAKYYYKYLGWVHCQKENLLARLLPANTYTPFSPKCDINFVNNDNLDSNINCNQNAQAEPPPGTFNKEAFAMLAERLRPGGHPHVEECYNDVVSRALTAGVNPTFTLLIWLIESGASNYDGFDFPIEDFGVHKTNNNPDVPESIDFNGQINFFLNLPYAYTNACGKSDMETFAARFKDGSCTSTQASLKYLNKLKDRWELIAPGIPFPNYP